MQLSCANQDTTKDPLSPDLILHLDASDRETLLDANGNMVANVDGAPVSRINSKGRSNLAFLNITNAVFNPVMRNGLSGIVVNPNPGTVSNMNWSTATTNLLKNLDTTGMVLFYVGRSTNTNQNAFFFQALHTPSRYFNAHFSDGGGLYMNVGGLRLTTTYPHSTWGMFEANVSPSLSLQRLRCKQSGGAFSAYVTGALDTTHYASMTGITPGFQNSGVVSMLLEFRLYEGEMTDTRRDAIVAELTSKWNV